MGVDEDIWKERGVTVDPRGDVEEEIDGKYLILGTPHYDAPGDAGSTAYLRLGAVVGNAGDPDVWTSPSSSGEDLAALVQGFADDTRERAGGAPEGSRPPPLAVVHGDLGKGLVESKPLDDEDRRSQSKILHTRGGWRDHSDGNRITTTRGDKVEVIGGNYKLLVLGRHDTRQMPDPAARQRLVGEAAGVDMSGGLVDGASLDLRARMVADASPGEADTTPGVQLDIEYSWQQDSDGTWAWTQSTTIGKEVPDLSNPNYRVVNKSWFDTMTSTTGSEARRVSYIGDTTNTTSIAESVTVRGTNKSELHGTSIESWTAVASINDVTDAFLATAGKGYGLSVEADVGDIIAQAQAALAVATVWHGVVAFDDHIGLHSDVHASSNVELRGALHADKHLGPHVETHSGAHIDLHLGAHLDLHGGGHATTELSKIDLEDATMRQAYQQIHDHGGASVKISDSYDLQLAAVQALQMAAAHMDG